MQAIAFTKSALCVLSIALSLSNPASANDKKPWAKHCTLVGIPADPHGKGEFDRLMQDFVRECAPVQACVLACMRSHCGFGAGGCFHDCGTDGFRDYGPPEALAELYAAKDNKVCPSAPN